MLKMFGRKFIALIIITLITTIVFMVMSALPIFTEKLTGSNYVELLAIAYSGFFGANVWQKRNESKYGSCIKYDNNYLEEENEEGEENEIKHRRNFKPARNK